LQSGIGGAGSSSGDWVSGVCSLGAVGFIGRQLAIWTERRFFFGGSGTGLDLAVAFLMGLVQIGAVDSFFFSKLLLFLLISFLQFFFLFFFSFDPSRKQQSPLTFFSTYSKAEGYLVVDFGWFVLLAVDLGLAVASVVVLGAWVVVLGLLVAPLGLPRP
jgi:hypothetical protein